MEDENIETKTYEKHLKCLLTEEEKQESASVLVQLMEDKKRKESELDSVKNQFKGELSRIEAGIEANANKVRDGFEFRQIPVEERRDYDDKKLTVTRLDTYEIIECRKLRNDEMQRSIPGLG